MVSSVPTAVLLVGSVGLVFVVACGGGASGEVPAYHVPLLAELFEEADGSLGVVDRTAEISGAVDADVASIGAAPDLSSASDGLRMVFDSRGMDSVEGVEGGSYQTPSGPGTQFNLLAGTVFAAQADLTTAVLVAVPAAAVNLVLRGQTTEIAPNVWASTNTVSDGQTSVTGLWVVAWVDVGWVAELRLWSSDGVYDNTRWFNGFVSADQQVGWWDFYDGAGSLTGVIEWVVDGEGTGELGLASTAGGTAGQALGYLFTPDTGFIGFHDPNAGDSFVTAYADHSGAVQSPSYNYGALSCWSASGFDVACPEE